MVIARKKTEPRECKIIRLAHFCIVKQKHSPAPSLFELTWELAVLKPIGRCFADAPFPLSLPHETE